MSNKRAILINFLNRIEFGFKLKLADAGWCITMQSSLLIYSTPFLAVFLKTLTFTEQFHK